MYSKLFTFALVTFIASIFSAILAGCGRGGVSTATTPSTPASPISSSPSDSSTTPISVLSSVPTNGTANVALNSTIQITFSSAASASTVNSTDIVVTDSSGVVAGSVSYNSDNSTATFTPSTAFAANTTYTVKISGVTSSTGTAMTSAYSFSFATAPPPAGTSAPLQYQASLEGNGGNFGQATVDTAGNFTIQLVGATATQTFTVEFCPLIPQNMNQLNCFSVGTVSTDGNGNGSLTAIFPKTGGWAGDFMLYTASNPNPNTQAYTYSTDLVGSDTTQVYMSTLQLTSTVNGATLSTGNPQASLTSGTIVYSGTGESNGSLAFTLTGAPANTTLSPSEGTIESAVYELVSSTGQSSFTTNSAGAVNFTVSQDPSPGDILEIAIQGAKEQGYVGGFSVP